MGLFWIANDADLTEHTVRHKKRMLHANRILETRLEYRQGKRKLFGKAVIYDGHDDDGKDAQHDNYGHP